MLAGPVGDRRASRVRRGSAGHDVCPGFPRRLPMSTLKSLFTAAFGAATLAACVVAPTPPYGAPAAPYGYASDGEIVATVAPPAPYVEPLPAAPFVGAVWIGGYWGYRGGRHEWVPGR